VIIPSSFNAPWWLRNSHVQTVLPLALKTQNNIPYQLQRLVLPDGDFVDVFWCEPSQPPVRDNPPVAIVLHGMGGCFASHYVPGTIRALLKHGYRVAFLHARGCSGEPNRLPVTFHAADTSELNHLVRTVRTKYPVAPVAVVGFSLGGSILLKWLGETSATAAISAAVAVCVPFDLSITADAINQGFARLYQMYLLRRLRELAIAKLTVHPAPLNAKQIKAVKTLRDYDHRMTARINGFSSVDDYYGTASCRQYLGTITVPTLIVNAVDDPFVPPLSVPTEREMSDSVMLELSQHGGHVGFLRSVNTRTPRYFEDRIPGFFDEYMG
jgi:predicted alpha/beta-fold hydrolase